MSMRTFGFVPTCALMLGLVWMMVSADPVWAQRSSSSAFGSSTSGQFNSRSGNNLQDNFGQSTGGQFGSGGSTGELGQTSESGLKNNQPQGREFLEGAFVGRDAQDVRDTFNKLSRGGRRRAMMDMVIENLNEMRESRQRWRNQQSQPPAVRIQLRPAFDYPTVPADQVAMGVQTRLNTILQRRTLHGRGITPPRLEMKGRTATLHGSVPSVHEKSLIGQLVAIEPGISKVENLLVVDP